MDLDEATHGDALEVLLRFLVHEVAAGHRPALCDSGERHGPFGGEVQVVGCAQREVGEELQIFDAVGAELEVGAWDAVLGGAF